MQADSLNYVNILQPMIEHGVNLVTVYRSLLNIVAHVDETQYTQGMLRQTTEAELDDLVRFEAITLNYSKNY